MLIKGQYKNMNQTNINQEIIKKAMSPYYY